MPTKTVSKVWKFYGDSQDGEFAHCLLCKYNPNKGVDVAIKVNILCFSLLTFCKCHLFDYSIINDQVGRASGGSTHGLRNHLKNFHKKEFLDMQHEKEEKTKKKNCLSICWTSHPTQCFIAFNMKSYYPVPSHFQFSGRDGSGT